MNFIKLLREYGFTEREAKTYLACLEYGENTPSTIARRTNEKRVTTYTVLRGLQKKGIANEIIKNGKRHFRVLDPEDLLKIYQKKYEKLKKITPLLSSIPNEYAHKTNINFYEGIKGIKKISEDRLKSKGELLSIIGYKNINPTVKDFLFKEFMPNRVKKGIPIKSIISSNSEKDSKRYTNKDNKKYLKDTILIKEKIFDMESDIVIYNGNKISILMYKDKEISGIIIENKTLHDSFKSIFDLIRKLAKTK